MISQSVRDIADEIVVVDSHSTDNTKRVCETFGVRFIEHAFEGYVNQKNYAITQATFPHQLSLDADEALSDELRESIKKAKENWQSDGYRMNRLTNYCGKWIDLGRRGRGRDADHRHARRPASREARRRRRGAEGAPDHPRQGLPIQE